MAFSALAMASVYLVLASILYARHHISGDCQACTGAGAAPIAIAGLLA